MKRYVKDAGLYADLMEKLKDKFHDQFGHILTENILVIQDTEFEVKPPKTKKDEDPTEEQVEKYENKKKKAWKFQIKKFPEMYADVMDTNKEFILVVRDSLVKDLTESQVIAYLYTELRKIDRDYKLVKPDLHTFSDLIELVGRPDWDQAFDIPNILE